MYTRSEQTIEEEEEKVEADEMLVFHRISPTADIIKRRLYAAMYTVSFLPTENKLPVIEPERIGPKAIFHRLNAGQEPVALTNGTRLVW